MTVDLIGEWMAGWNDHDADRVVSVFADDGLHEDVPSGAILRGKEEIKDFVNGWFEVSRDCRFELTASFVAEGFAGAEWTASGTQQGDLPGMPATNKPYSVRGASIFEVRDGLLRRCSDYWDMATFMRQLGFLA